MKFIETGLHGAWVVELTRLSDERGSFCRTYCKDEFSQIGFAEEFVQMNHSVTVNKGTIRGMHFQVPPHSETKLIRCIAGEVYDVIVDIRSGSPTFLKHFATTLSAQNNRALFVPGGFAHGFQALKDNSEMLYCHTEFYNPNAESGLLAIDDKLGITWPLPVGPMSERDKKFTPIQNSFKGI